MDWAVEARRLKSRGPSAWGRARRPIVGLVLASSGALAIACAVPAHPIRPPPNTAPSAPSPALEASSVPSPTPAPTSTSSSAGLAVSRAIADDTTSPLDAQTLEVPRDKRVFVVFGDPNTSRVFVYLHGRCGDPLAFLAWAGVGRHFGTIVSFVGDVKCDGGRSKWGADTAALDGRISRALEVVEAQRKTALDKEHRIVIGYSAGALRAEALATRFPDRYPRVILIGGPRPPRPESLGHTRSILLMAGQLDIRQPLMDAATDLAKAGRNAHFIVIPHARHGEYGPQATETMRDALAWVVDENPPESIEPLKTSKALE